MEIKSERKAQAGLEMYTARYGLNRLASLSFFVQFMWAAMLFGFLPSTALAAALNDIDAVPHLGSAGKQGYSEFLAAEKHRAFVIAPGGVWFWKAGEDTAEAAAENALHACLEETGRACVVYAVNDRVVFDEKAWTRLWGPYQNKKEAARAYIGKERGDRFFNLAFRSESGKLIKLSDLKGRVVMLHFWGSWCPACLREMPELQQLHRALGDRLAEGGDLREIARFEWLAGAIDDGIVHARMAIEVLEQVAHEPDAPRALAMAQATMAQLHMLADSAEPAIRWGLAALSTFEALADAEGLAYALNTVGFAELIREDRDR